MDEHKLERVREVLERMDVSYWREAADRNSFFSNEVTLLTDEFKELYLELALTQFEILQARHDGYKRLIEAAGGSDSERIISENRDIIAALHGKRHQFADSIAAILYALETVVDKIQLLGDE